MGDNGDENCNSYLKYHSMVPNKNQGRIKMAFNLAKQLGAKHEEFTSL